MGIIYKSNKRRDFRQGLTKKLKFFVYFSHSNGKGGAKVGELRPCLIQGGANKIIGPFIRSKVQYAAI
jgi:hypothetical protein